MTVNLLIKLIQKGSIMWHTRKVASSEIPIVSYLRMQNEKFLDKREHVFGSRKIEHIRDYWALEQHFKCAFNRFHFRFRQQYFKGRWVTFWNGLDKDKNRFRWNRRVPRPPRPYPTYMKATLGFPYNDSKVAIEGNFTIEELNEKVYYLQELESCSPSITAIENSLSPVECAMALEKIYGYKISDHHSSEEGTPDFNIDLNRNFGQRGCVGMKKYDNEIDWINKICTDAQTENSVSLFFANKLEFLNTRKASQNEINMLNFVIFAIEQKNEQLWWERESSKYYEYNCENFFFPNTVGHRFKEQFGS